MKVILYTRFQAFMSTRHEEMPQHFKDIVILFLSSNGPKSEDVRESLAPTSQLRVEAAGKTGHYIQSQEACDDLNIPLCPASCTQFSLLLCVALKGQWTSVFNFHHGLLCWKHARIQTDLNTIQQMKFNYDVILFNCNVLKWSTVSHFRSICVTLFTWIFG